jgi:hypothetical protein
VSRSRKYSMISSEGFHSWLLSLSSSTAWRGGKTAITAFQCPFLFVIFPECKALKIYARATAVESRVRDRVEDNLSDMLRSEP